MAQVLSQNFYIQTFAKSTSHRRHANGLVSKGLSYNIVGILLMEWYFSIRATGICAHFYLNTCREVLLESQICMQWLKKLLYRHCVYP